MSRSVLLVGLPKPLPKFWRAAIAELSEMLPALSTLGSPSNRSYSNVMDLRNCLFGRMEVVFNSAEELLRDATDALSSRRRLDAYNYLIDVFNVSGTTPHVFMWRGWDRWGSCLPRTAGRGGGQYGDARRVPASDPGLS
jgi:hypothetical protein